MNEYLQRVYWNNTVLDYLLVIGAMLATWVVLQIIKRLVIGAIRKFTKKSKTDIDDVLISGLEKFIVPYVYILINFGIIDQLKLSAGINKAIAVAIAIVTVYFGARFINHAIQVSLNLYMERRYEASSRRMQMNGILNIFKVVVWALGLLFLLDNLGYQVTTIITGLGIGGIAIALAAQNILSDLFSYFVIFFDKPFEIGDFVVTGDKNGTVEQIGIKTSRIRTLSGEELVMPNAELVKSPIHNFKKMATRRVLFSIQVTYETPLERLKEIPGIIKEIITTKETTRFDRSHLKALGSYYIDFETVYTILAADYNVYMDIHQQVCLDILQVCKDRGIELAIPTQLVRFDKPQDDIKEDVKTEVITA